MPSTSDPGSGPLARRSRTIMVTYLGSVVRQLGNWMPIGATITLMSQLGLDAPSVRTAVFRFKERGWLESSTRGSVRGYEMSDTALQTLSAGDDLIWHGRQSAQLSQGWCIINASIPESARSGRHKLRAHLAHLGFGNAGTAMWIAPSSALPQARQAVAELGLDEYVAIFVGDYVGTQPLASLVQQSWDLADINHGYLRFLSDYEPLAQQGRWRAMSSQEAFVHYVTAVDQWRPLPFRDPGLPEQVLPSDWAGPRAMALVQQLVQGLREPALAHARNLWPAALSG